MKEALFRPGEIIYKLNENDKKIYFILKGEIQLFVEHNYERIITIDKLKVINSNIK